MIKQETHDGEFLGRQTKLLILAKSSLLHKIQAHLPEREFSERAAALLDPPQQRADTREQFISAERFEEVIISASIESADSVLNPASGRQHQNRTE